MSEPVWTLPGYLVETRLGAGGSGEVWRGRVAATGEAVALKRVPVDDAEQLRAARAEAAVLATLDHPNLIRLHEVLALPDAVVLVLDLAAGGSLGELIAARGRLTPGEVIAALAPIAAALAYAHMAGVVHGDVTPANVLFTDFGLPLLADLGVARLTGDAALPRSTPAYLDPSVAAGQLPGTHTDVFMVAAVALHALTGRPPWPGESVDAVLAAAAAAELDVAARLAAAAVPEPIGAVLARALSADPAARGTAADFALELRHAGEPVAVELSAGRARAVASAAPAAGQGGARVDWRAVSTGVGTARPDFDRPAPVVETPTGAPALTRGVRVRPLAPRPVRRPLWRRTGVRVAAGLGCAAVIGAALGLAARGADGARSAVRAPSVGRPSVSAAPVGASGTPVRPAEVPAQPDVSTAASVLAQLDAARAQAFAQRDPSRLAEVYLPGPLLQADAALLTRLVPPGCGLVGVRTRYRELSLVLSAPDQLVVTTAATLAPSTLLCAGTTAGSAPAAGPETLRIRLVRSGRGYRIAAQQVSPAK